MKILETQRLVLRPLTWSDFGFFRDMHAHPEVARYLGDGLPRSTQASRTWFETMLAWYRRDGLGHLAAVRRSDGALVGRSGLCLYEVERDVATRPRAWWGLGSAPEGVDVEGVLEVGYAFAREAWGHGYATEAARAVRDHAFADREAPRVMSIIYPGNAGSIRVAEKNDMRRIGEIDAWGSVLERYQIERPE